MSTDRIGYGPVLWVAADAKSGEDSSALLAAVMDEAGRKLAGWQSSEGVTAQPITIQEHVEPPYPMSGRRSRALPGVVLSTVLMVPMLLKIGRRRRLGKKADLTP